MLLIRDLLEGRFRVKKGDGAKKNTCRVEIKLVSKKLSVKMCILLQIKHCKSLQVDVTCRNISNIVYAQT